MTTTVNPNLGQIVLAFLESDALTAFGPDLLAFLQADAAAGGDPIKIEAAYLKLQGDLAGDSVTFVGDLNAQLANTLAAKLQAKLTAPAAAVPVAGASA